MMAAFFKLQIIYLCVWAHMHKPPRAYMWSECVCMCMFMLYG